MTHDFVCARCKFVHKIVMRVQRDCEDDKPFWESYIKEYICDIFFNNHYRQLFKKIEFNQTYNNHYRLFKSLFNIQ